MHQDAASFYKCEAARVPQSDTDSELFIASFLVFFDTSLEQRAMINEPSMREENI